MIERARAEADGSKLLQRLGAGTGVDRAMHLPITDSTSTDARSWACEGDPAELLVLADGQRAGRGRLGRTFLSPSGEGLWLSRVIRIPEGQPVPPSMTLAAGTAVCLALRESGVTGAALKWPNDVLIDGRKTAGILAEASQDRDGRPFLVLGIGVNLNIRTFPPELAGVATSVQLATGLSLDRLDLLAAILRQLDRLTRLLFTAGFRSIRPQYLACSATVGREVLLLDPAAAGASAGAATGAAPQTAWCIDVDDDGALVLMDADGRRFTRHAGEVSLREPSVRKAAGPAAGREDIAAAEQDGRMSGRPDGNME